MKLRSILAFVAALLFVTGCGLLGTPDSAVTVSIAGPISFVVEVTEEEDMNGNPFFTTTVITSEITVNFGTSAGAPQALIKSYSVELLDNDGNPLGGHASTLSSDAAAVNLPPGYECLQEVSGEDPYGCSPEFRRDTWQAAAEPLVLLPITMVGAFDMLAHNLNKASARFVFTVESTGRTYEIVRNVSVTYLGDCVTGCGRQ